MPLHRVMDGSMPALGRFSPTVDWIIHPQTRSRGKAGLFPILSSAAYLLQSTATPSLVTHSELLDLAQ